MQAWKMPCPGGDRVPISTSTEFWQQVERWSQWLLQLPDHEMAVKTAAYARESSIAKIAHVVVDAIQPKEVAEWCALVQAVPNLFYLQVNPDNDTSYITAHEALTEALWVFVFEGLQERWPTIRQG